MSFHARHGGGGGSPHRGAGYPPSGSPPPRHYVEDDVEDNPFEQPTSSASRHYPPQQQDRHSQPQQFAPHRGGDYRSHSEPKGHLPPHGPLSSSSSSSPSVSFHSNVRQGAPSPHSEREGRSPSHTQQQYHHPQPQHHAGKDGGSDGAGNIVPILLRRMDEMQRSFQQENQDLRQEVQQLRMMLQELLTHHQNNSPTRGASPTNGGYDSESSAAGGMRLKVDPNRRSCHLCRKEYNIQIAAQHFEGKTHKQQLRKLLDEQNWDELRRQAELARASGVVTTAEFYGRCANQRVEDHHHYSHHQPSNSSARQPQPQQQYRSLSPHTHSHSHQQYPPHSAAQDPHRAHHHHHSSSSPLHSSSHAAAGGGGSSFHPFAGFVSNGGNFGAHRTAVGGGGSPSAAGGGYSPRSQY